MIGQKFNLQFFDRAIVHRKLAQGELKALSKIGAFVRRTAKRFLRRKGTKRNPASLPGEPPRQHTGTLRRLLFFGLDTTNLATFIGPIPFRGKAEAPRLLEHGGSASRRFRVIGPEGSYTDASGKLRTKDGLLTEGVVRSRRRAPARRVHYKPRPFMGPALDEEIAKGTIPKAFRDILN